MYQVKLDDGYFYYPNDKKYIITNPKLNLQLNDAGYFECDVPQENPRYNEIYVRKSIIAVYKDGDMIFRGEVRETELDLYGNKHVYAIGELAFLNDSIQPQARYQTTPLSMFTSLINQHNAQVESAKQFAVGMVTVDDPNDYVYRYTNFEPTLTVIINDLCNSLNGFLRIRYSGGTRYLDLIKIENYGVVSSQDIRLGKNLLDYASNTNGTGIATAVVPLGARQDKSVVEGLDAYLTIESVNDGKNYLVNSDAVAVFGYCKVVKHWDDVTVAANLKTKAQEWLETAQYAELTYQIDAVDLSAIDVSIDDFRLGDRVHVICRPYNVDTTTPIRALTIFLDDASKNQITLGGALPLSITSRIASENVQLEEEIPQESSVLQQAKQNAIQILEGTEGGYISYTFDNQEHMTGMRIMDALLEEDATQKWVWNLGGLGYLKRPNISSPWTDLGVALTMDGKIVADFITAGTMYADRIKGGTLSLGGNANENGVLQIKNASGTVVGKWDKDGIDVTTGSIKADLINSGTLNASLITVTNLSASSITSGTMSANRISGGTIDANNVTINNLNASKITSGSINASVVTITNLNASNITSGSLSASRISGGTLTLGGSNNVNGSMAVKNASNQTIASINNEGIYLEDITGTYHINIKAGTIYGGVVGSDTGYINWGQSYSIQGDLVRPVKIAHDSCIVLSAPYLFVAQAKEATSGYVGITETIRVVTSVSSSSYTYRDLYVVNGLIVG